MNSKKIHKKRGHTQRRTGSLKRLENQLLTGFKTVTLVDGIGTTPLTDSDKIRIRKEIEVLKSRI